MPKRKEEDEEEEAIEEQPDNKRTKLTSSSSSSACDSSAIVESSCSSSSASIVEKPPASLHDCEVARFLYSECKGLSILPPELINLIHEYKEWHDESEGDAWFDGDWVKKEGKWLQSIDLLKWKNGDWWDGLWEDGQLTGARGKRTIGNEVKEGIWIEGAFFAAFEGKWNPYEQYSSGKLRFEGNGNVYEGDLFSWDRHGRGTLTKTNGDKYAGEWRDDNKHGFGEYRWADGSRYVGGWVDDLREGNGRYNLEDKRIDQGEWKADNIVKGQRADADGIYEGLFKPIGRASVRHGLGVYLWVKEGMRYEGQTS